MYVYIYVYIYVDRCFTPDQQKIPSSVEYLYMTMYMHICVYMKNSFLKRHKRQSKNRACNANAKLGYHVLEKNVSCLEKNFSSTYTYICIYIYVKKPKELYSKEQTMNYELAIGIVSPFSFGMTLIVIWKRALHIYIYIYIDISAYIYIYNNSLVLMYVVDNNQLLSTRDLKPEEG